VAQSGRKVARFALIKSDAYAFFLDKLLISSRKTATAARLRKKCGVLRTRLSARQINDEYHYNCLFLKEIVGEKTGAGNKPGSVENNHSSGIAVTSYLKQPTRESARDRRWTNTRTPLLEALCVALLPYLVLLRAGFTVPRAVTSRAVRSYRTFSPLPTKVGGLFSVALSMGSRPPGVTWRPVRRSPDFPL